jgi:hypothetical protein
MSLYKQLNDFTEKLNEFSKDFCDMNEIFKRLIIDVGEAKNCNREEFLKFLELVEGQFKN